MTAPNEPSPDAARIYAMSLSAADRASDAVKDLATDADEAKIVAAVVHQIKCLRVYWKAQERVRLEMRGWKDGDDT